MKIKNLAVLTGKKTTIKNNVVKYLPTFEDIDSNDEISDLDNAKNAQLADIRTDVNFSQGVVKFKFKAENKLTGVLILGENAWNAGLSYYRESFLIRDLNSKVSVLNGSFSQFSKNEEISIKFEMFGSNGKLYVNNILFCKSVINVPSLPLTFRILSNGKVTLYDIELESIRPKLFVVMQFSEEYNNLYNDVIKPIAEEVGFECLRADEFHASTPILKDIIRSIKESSAIIAEITPDNPNVFYEIGYAHAIQKPTILICDKDRDKLPFDISSFRTLFYENTITGKTKVENSLRKYLENILK